MRTRRVLLAGAVLALVGMFWGVRPVGAHAVLMESAPAAQGKVAGPDVPIRVRFNVRIDAGRSRLTLVLPDGKMQPLEAKAGKTADTLVSQATGLARGDYHIHWQVLASDGHITQGDIPFTVTGA